MSDPPDISDFRQELLAAFAVEYRDHLTVVRSGLAAARRGEQVDLKDIFRRLHSLKGAARAVDMPDVETLAHDLEAQMANVIETQVGLSRDRITMIEAGLDKVEVAIETALGGGDPDPVLVTDEPATGYLRVEAGQVTDLVIAATQLAQAIERQDGLAERLQTIEIAIRRSRRMLEPLVHRPDMPPTLADLAAELSVATRQAALIRHDLRDSSWALDEALRRVRDDVDRMSLVPAETVFGPMARMVRELARDEGVEVETEFQGLGLQADRRVLQALKDPVMQLLRNAVSHGSEPAAKRRARGRPPATRITLAVRSGGGRLIIRVIDDGPGPDLEAIRRRGLDRALLTPAEARSATAEQLLALVFEPGFSTRADVGPLSGRGMGLSIVAEAARELGGTARMTTGQERDRPPSVGRPDGTAVEISVPLLVARQTAVLLGFGDATVALPTSSLVRLLRVPLVRIEPLGGEMCVRIDGSASDRVAPIAVLGHLLGMGGPALPVHDGHVKLAVIRGGAFGQRLALAVDRFQDVRRFLSHSAEVIGIDTDLVAGFVMIGSETPAALLSADGLIGRWSRRGGWSGEVAADAAAPDIASAVRTILVADDSITSRTLEKSILEAHGYRVVVAVDGLEALDILQSYGGPGRGEPGQRTEGGIDMVLADVEMPRMDGFSLLQTMKENPALADIPVIIMTSRESPADVRRGLDLGASAYIAKQTFDQQDLLGAIGRLL